MDGSVKAHVITVMSIVRCLVRFDAALVLFFLVLATGLSTAQTPPKVTIAYAAVSPIFAGVWMAKEMGAFEKHGVKADLIYISLRQCYGPGNGRRQS